MPSSRVLGDIVVFPFLLGDTMAVWRTKACEMFGFAANKHSYARGKVELFADLLELADKSAEDPWTLDRIAEYVDWASLQTSNSLASAVDLAFWLPMFRNDRIQRLLGSRFSPELLDAKKALLLDDTE